MTTRTRKTRRVHTLRDFQVHQHPSMPGCYKITARTPTGWNQIPTVYQDLPAALAAVDKYRRSYQAMTSYFGG